ncbi:family 43 glycosylhydrolase [Pedobacter sp. SD-b]|uniref:Family 43 glycosylhydrolase n=1 Tax=Pedobacter segetis TaxID=2793069 RepID=A0ABS1BMG6_9SPHI|nr:family 43 glycosylhydrolase [Pedobacter segetis]MBK0384070.1 family 43 glycosylhydrolase [Pedobacter segetis]
MKRKVLLAGALLTLVGLAQCKKEKTQQQKVDAVEGAVSPQAQTTLAQTNIFPDQPWKDTAGNLINAHSGGVIFQNGYYYWYGTHKIPGSSEKNGKTDGGVHCYRSKDLVNWTDYGIVLAVNNTPGSDLELGCKIQRVKVVKCDNTGKYICYFKLYLKGEGYDKTYVAVATSNSPTGQFTYDHKFLAANDSKGTGDHFFYKADNGDLYHIAKRKTDGVLVYAKMTTNYLNPATSYTVMSGIQKYTEGVAVIYKSGTYHLLGSGSSGWDPNPPRYYTATSLAGPWTVQSNPLSGTNSVTGIGPDLTWGGQSNYMFKLDGEENKFVANFDVHVPTNPSTSRYIWLPFRIDQKKLHISWQSSWSPGL